MPTVPETVRAAKPVTAFSRVIRFLNIYAPCAMPRDDMRNARNTKRDSRVSSGWWKNMDISGAQKKRMMYIVMLVMTLNQNTAL